MKPLTRKQVADQSGVTIEAVRFYEREGIIEEPPRTEAGYRQYPPDTVRRIRFVKRAQDLGFTLPEVKELLALQLTPGATPADVKRRALQKVKDIESKIQTLTRMKASLEHLTEACHGEGALSDCPILEALDAEPIH